MKYLAYIALFSFIAIAVFGFAGLMSQGSFMHCAKALSGAGGACPDAFAAGLLHVKIYQGFSQSLFAAFLAAILLVFASTLIEIPSIKPVTTYLDIDQLSSESSFRKRIYDWINLHQTSDPLV